MVMMEQFEQLNKELTGSNYVKKYEWLGKIISNKNEVNTIELILSFQFNGKTFTGTDRYIAHRISKAPSSINDILKRLEDAGMIHRNTDFNGKSRKRERTIKVNTQHLLNLGNTFMVGHDSKLTKDCEEYNSIPTTTQKTQSPDKPIPPKELLTKSVEVSDESIPIPFADFDVQKALIHYLGFSPNDKAIINSFDQAFIKFRNKNVLKRYNLHNLIDFFNHNLDGFDGKETLIKRITDDIVQYNKVNELTSA